MGDKWELAWLMNNALEKYNKRKEEEEMTVKNKDAMHDELVRQIRDVGESLIKNAESIAGSETYLDELNIKVYLNPKVCNPSITIEREFTPERYVERVTKKDYAF